MHPPSTVFAENVLPLKLRDGSLSSFRSAVRLLHRIASVLVLRCALRSFSLTHGKCIGPGPSGPPLPYGVDLWGGPMGRTYVSEMTI
jgi:hypothetical protein